MSFPITCPYCFGEMDDDQVLFRSDRVSAREQDIIPAEFDDVEDFQSRYRGADKEEILGRYAEWAFFSERDPFKDPNDPYRRFWDKYSGASTERDSLEEKLGLLPYHRPVIDPSDPAHQVYLREQPDGSYFIRSNSGMVTQIALKSGETCAQRVCRYCRNPLPDGYGKNPVKYVTLVGVTGAGKTVYFSQLLKRMGDYAANVGLDATVAHRGVSEFLKDNQIVAGKKLPPPTPFQQFQQPLFYELVGVDGDGSRAVHTFVLYDVAGELFEEGNARYLEKFAPFIKRADGILVLIDPMQIDAISGASRQDAEKSPAATALGAIQSIVTDDNDALGCTKPVAVCLSQIDREAVQKVLDDELKRLLNANVEPERDERGFPRSVFNAEQHRPIAEKLREFLTENQLPLVKKLDMSFPDHDFFAFTSLGCAVEDGKPVGPVIPKRIEEPLYWLFYKLGFLTSNEEVLPPCPRCGTNEFTYVLPESERRRKILFATLRRDYGCGLCGKKWRREKRPPDGEREPWSIG
jgi:hypothetical protein